MNDYLYDRVTVAVGAHYLIECEIGRGGMAVVYRAKDLRLHRPVAIKVLPPDVAFNADVRTRFIREAQTAAQLNHPNIVSIYAVDEPPDSGLVYFAMAYIDGESLGARLAREGRWPIDASVRVLRDVADALAYAHARGVVHRDIKPDNILIDRATGRPMVTDFGIARAAAGETRLTVTGVAVGTPAYMSPEQALGERELDGRSDIYSLAVVGYQMLAGETPFKAANTPAMLVKHVSERPRPIRDQRPEVPAYLAVAIDRALAKRPEDRWADAAEFRDALDAAQSAARPRRASSAAPAPPPPLPPVPAVGFDASPVPESNGAIADSYRRTGRAQSYDDRPIEDRVIAFRRSAVSFAVMSPLFFVINIGMTHGFPWFFIPSGFMLLDAIRKGGSIWSDGVGPIDAFKKGIRTRLRAGRGEAPPIALPTRAPPPVTRAVGESKPANALVAPEVLAGPYGDLVRRAAADRAHLRDIAAALRPVERELIPDVGPTVDALVDRVATLATTLHRLDADVSGASLGTLDARIASLSTEPATTERERRLTLLQRQRGSLRDLLERRRGLVDQMESAGLMLQNLKLDLLKLRSSGLGASIEDVTSATQEARALSRDIGHVLDASDDLKKL